MSCRKKLSGDGGAGRAHAPKIWEKIFFGQLLCKIRAFFRAKNHVKFGHSGNFSYIFFWGGGKNVVPPKVDWVSTPKNGAKIKCIPTALA